MIAHMLVILFVLILYCLIVDTFEPMIVSCTVFFLTISTYPHIRLFTHHV